MIETSVLENLRPNSDMLVNQGRVKKNNEDSVDKWEPHDPVELARSGCLYVLADGVGGTARGEKASRQAVDRILHHYTSSTESDLEERLASAIDAANEEIFEHNSALAGERTMHTTVVACVVRGDRLIGANVGDSRAYLVREGQLNQLSEDHTEVARLLREGEISPEEARNYQGKNRVLRVLGLDENVQPHFFDETLLPGDAILLCSDGLSRYIDSGKIAEDEVVSAVTQMTSKGAVNDLVAKANACGGKDNISVVVVQIGRKVASQPTTVISQSMDRWQWVILAAGVASFAILAIGLILGFSLGFLTWGPNQNPIPTQVSIATPISTTFVAPTTMPVSAPVAQSTLVPTAVTVPTAVSSATPSPAKTLQPTSLPTLTPTGPPPPTPKPAPAFIEGKIRYAPSVVRDRPDGTELARLGVNDNVRIYCQNSNHLWIKIDSNKEGGLIQGWILVKQLQEESLTDLANKLLTSSDNVGCPNQNPQ